MPIDDLSPKLAVHCRGLRVRPAALPRERQQAGAPAAGRKTGAGSSADLLDLRWWEVAHAEALEPDAIVAAATDALGDRHANSREASVPVLSYDGASEARLRQLELTGVRPPWARRHGARAAGGGIGKRNPPRGRAGVVLGNDHARGVTGVAGCRAGIRRWRRIGATALWALLKVGSWSLLGRGLRLGVILRPAADDEAETQCQCADPDHTRTSDRHVEL